VAGQATVGRDRFLARHGGNAVAAGVSGQAPVVVRDHIQRCAGGAQQVGPGPLDDVGLVRLEGPNTVEHGGLHVAQQRNVGVGVGAAQHGDPPVVLAAALNARRDPWTRCFAVAGSAA
jgi:hypothetical protein